MLTHLPLGSCQGQPHIHTLKGRLRTHSNPRLPPQPLSTSSRSSACRIPKSHFGSRWFSTGLLMYYILLITFKAKEKKIDTVWYVDDFGVIPKLRNLAWSSVYYSETLEWPVWFHIGAEPQLNSEVHFFYRNISSLCITTMCEWLGAKLIWYCPNSHLNIKYTQLRVYVWV